MFDRSLKNTGRDYTLTVALLAIALLFSPIILFTSRPLGYSAIALTLAISASCTSLAFLSWKKLSQLSIPTIEIS